MQAGGGSLAYNRPQRLAAVLHADTGSATCRLNRPWQVINTALDAFMTKL